MIGRWHVLLTPGPIFGYVSFREGSLGLWVCHSSSGCLAKTWPMGWTDWMEIWWDLGKGFGVSIVASGPILTFWKTSLCWIFVHVLIMSLSSSKLATFLTRRSGDLHLLADRQARWQGEPNLIVQIKEHSESSLRKYHRRLSFFVHDFLSMGFITIMAHHVGEKNMDVVPSIQQANPRVWRCFWLIFIAY